MVFKAAAAEPSEPSEPKAIVSHLELNEDRKKSPPNSIFQVDFGSFLLRENSTGYG